MPSRSLLKGTIILTIAAVITRLIGLGNRMVLSRLIGAEGLGLFQMIIPFYALAAVMANLGLPGAIVKTVGERHARGDFYEIEQIKSISLKFVLFSACCGAFLLFCLSFSPLNKIFPDQRIILPMRIMPFALFCAAIASIFKGFFQGQGNMIPTAVSQIGEQVVRVGFGLIGVLYFLPYGLEYAILGIMLGVAVGELAGLATVLYFYRHYHYQTHYKFSSIKKQRHSRQQVITELFRLAGPLVIIRLSGSVTNTIESLLIPTRLQRAGFTATEATALFGQLSGMAVPLLFLPTVAIIPLNTALVPSISGAASLGQKKRLKLLLRFSLWGTLFIGLLAGITLYLFHAPLTLLFYNAPTAAPLVAQLAISAPFAYLQFTTASILHGLGFPSIALINDLGGMGACLFLIYLLSANPAYGIQGAVWGYFAGFTLTTILDLYFIHKLTESI